MGYIVAVLGLFGWNLSPVQLLNS